jgi:hypothetical protein
MSSIDFDARQISRAVLQRLAKLIHERLFRAVARGNQKNAVLERSGVTKAFRKRLLNPSQIVEEGLLARFDRRGLSKRL